MKASTPAPRPRPPGVRLGLAAVAAPLLAACIVVPRSAEVYDPQCRSFVRQMVLETAVIGTIGHCHNDGCAAMLASMGVVTAASAVVAGSVAIVGNMVYWAERRGRCPAEPTPASPAPAAAPAPSPATAASGGRPRPPVVPGLQPFPATAPAGPR